MSLKSMKDRDALVVLSGGQDSTTCLFWAKENFKSIRAVTFDYNQRHWIEVRAAQTVAMMCGATSHEILRIPQALMRSASPLTSDAPLETYLNAEQMAAVIGDRVELTFVPMRNTMFLTIAMNLAMHYGITDLVTGVCQEDNANYPDCTQAFIHTLQDAFSLSLGGPVQIHAPLIRASKAASISIAMCLPGCMEALAFSHTSYDGKYPPTDMNHANVLRADGFAKAGVPDPLVIRAWREGVMSLPSTPNYDTLRAK